MKKYCLICLCLLGWMLPRSHAQFTGLWSVEEVKVGDQKVTPVAKWFQFETDQSLTSGNGGVRNMLGSYRLDEEKGSVLFYDEVGKEDALGPFTYSIERAAMQLQREEEGQAVTVILQRTQEIPLAPWDEMVGLWELQKGGTPGDMQSISIRWDRRFVMRTSMGRKAGVWHIDGHRPILRLISDAGDAEDSQWTFTFPTKGQLKWEREVDGRQEVLILLRQQ